jgi:hypothetical protein
MIKTLLLLPASLPWRQKAFLWTVSTLLLSTTAFGASYLGFSTPTIIGAIAIAIIPLSAGLAKVLHAWALSPDRHGTVIAKSVGV